MDMHQITQKQQHTLETIAQFINQRGISPTFTELRMKLGINSNQSLIDRLTSLERKELLIRNPRQHRSISLGPKATEYFRSLEGYITSPTSSAIYDQSPGAFNKIYSGTGGFANNRDFAGNTTSLAIN
jgi:SOS-response transcriptional repressor LexA